MLCLLCSREKVSILCYRTFDSKIRRFVTNGILSSRLGVCEVIIYNVPNQSDCKIILSKLSQESIYIHLKKKRSNRDYLSMLDVINPKKHNQEMNEVNFFKKRHQWFLIGFDFRPLILVGNKFATGVKETLLCISNFPKFVSLITCDNTSC